MSSTAHLLIAERLIGFDDPGGVFTTMIQLGSILAVVWLYREKVLAIARGLFSDAAAQRFVAAIAVATVPLLVVAALFGKYVRGVLYGRMPMIAVAFIVGGIVMLLVERFRPKPDVFDVDALPVGRAAAIGAFQALAVVPGVSRSGGTIVGALLLRVDRAAAAEFTFFLAMPAMSAAFAHDLWDLRHELGSARGLEIGVGFVTAFLASLLVVKPFLNYVRRGGFAPFAWYRIVSGLLLLASGL